MNDSRSGDELWNDDRFWFSPTEIPMRPRRVQPGVFGNGRLATQRDIEILLRGETDDEHPLQLNDVTYLLETTAQGDGLKPLLTHSLFLNSELLDRHMLIAGTTGAGKTQKFILPLLAAAVRDPKRTIIAIDAKGGVLYHYLRTLADRYRPGTRVEQVNLKVSGRSTVPWNPVSHIQSRADALEIAHAFVTNADVGIPSTGGANELFWVNSSINLLSDLLLSLKEHSEEQLTLARAKELVDMEPGDLMEYAENHPAKAHFYRRYPAVARVFQGSQHVTQQCVVADLAMRMQLLGDEKIVEATSGRGSLDLGRLLREGGILILEVPEGYSKQLIPMTNLFVVQLFSTLMRESMATLDGKLPRPCSVFLDEFGSAVGKLVDFDCRLSTLRSRAVSVLATVQTLSQIESLYGKGAGAILEGFCTKVFFGGGLAQADARFASEMSGVCTVENVTITETDEDGSLEATRVSKTRVPTPRPVLLPEEIMRPPVNALLGAPVTFFVPNVPPFQAYLPPAFQIPELNQAMKAKHVQPRLALPPIDETTQKIHTLKSLLDWDHLSGNAKLYWKEVEKRLRPTPRLLMELLTKLVDQASHHAMLNYPKESLLEMFATIAKQTGLKSLDGNLSFLQFTILQRLEQQLGENLDPTLGG
jgi:type IV secretory pathway TraG/TraD family ATPase VirD4